MKFVSMDAIMTRRKSVVCASFAVATVAGAMTFGATSPAFAGRQVHGSASIDHDAEKCGGDAADGFERD